MIKTELMSSENSLGRTLNVTGIGMRPASLSRLNKGFHLTLPIKDSECDRYRNENSIPPLPTGHFIQHSQKATTCNRHLKNQYIILIPVIMKILHFRTSDDNIVAKDKRMSLLSNNRKLND